MSDPSHVRLYIGNISPQLSQNISALETRLAKYGKLQSPIELRSKETFQDVNYFGYANVQISEPELNKLLSAFHKVKFMNSSLVIQKAKSSFNELRAQQYESIVQDEQKREREAREEIMKHDILQAHIKYGKEDKTRRLRNYFKIEQGSIRKTPRVKDPRRKLNVTDITYRVKFLIFNDKTKKYEKKVKIIKASHKQKLWGYNKDKHSTDLVFKYQHGVWIDGNNHIVEFPRNKNKKKTTEEGKNAEAAVDVYVPPAPKSTEKELKKTKSVLDDFLSNYNFDKPIDFNYDQDRKEKLEMNKDKFDYEAASRHLVQDFDDVSDEDENVPDQNPGKTNTSDTLKSLFNPGAETPQPEQANQEASSGGFAFNLGDSDIEDIDEEEEEEIPRSRLVSNQQLQTIATENITDKSAETPETAITERALFFPHFDSPFLVAQTQLNKLLSYNPRNSSNYESIANWPKEFEEQRVELMKGFKRRKRDVLRQGSKR